MKNNINAYDEKISNQYKVDIISSDTKDNVFYCLSMFAYPSWTWMHMWHVENYTATDVLARFKRMLWFKVLNPIGRDAFGLPTENYAMSVWKSAIQVTQENVENFRAQAKAMNWSHDWDREINTSSPEYYKWTQWLFEKLYEKWLVYRENSLVNRCDSCKTVLANDQVVLWKCERCETEVIQKKHPQWFIKITEYADRLIDDIRDLDRPEDTKKKQIEWIGRSKGIEIDFPVEGVWEISIFHNNVDELSEASTIVISPEHELIGKITIESQKNQIEEYMRKSSLRSNFQRIRDNDAEWVFTWAYATNPMNNNKIPIRISDYVLPDYANWSKLLTNYSENSIDIWFLEKYSLKGNQQSNNDSNAIDRLKSDGKIREKTIYKIRDWSVSRQRYWWSPIPIYYDDYGHPNLIPEEELPVILPTDIESYKPTGKSPLEEHDTFKMYKKDWVEYDRECDTLDTFVCSSFYFLRYIDPQNDKALIDKELAQKALPIDFYIWGREHTTGHLIYSRFIYKFLNDLWYVDTKEPFKKLIHQGVVYGNDWRRMSKRRWNVVNPNDVIKDHSSDSLRLWILFMWPIQQDKLWKDDWLVAMDKFLNKISWLQQKVSTDYIDEEKIMASMDDSIYKITQDIENLKFNTAISKLMIIIKLLNSQEKIGKKIFEKLLLVLAPFAPEISNNLWLLIWNTNDIHHSPWPKWLKESANIWEINLPIQINGKVKWTICIERWLSEEEIINKVMEIQRYVNYTNSWIKKVIYVKDKIINILV